MRLFSRRITFCRFLPFAAAFFAAGFLASGLARRFRQQPPWSSQRASCARRFFAGFGASSPSSSGLGDDLSFFGRGCRIEGLALSARISVMRSNRDLVAIAALAARVLAAALLEGDHLRAALVQQHIRPQRRRPPPSGRTERSASSPPSTSTSPKLHVIVPTSPAIFANARVHHPERRGIAGRRS